MASDPIAPPLDVRTSGRRPLLGGRIGLRSLARICHNVGTGLHAGVDIRRVLETEAMRGSGRQRAEMAQVLERVNHGDTLARAMVQSDGYFPPMLCEMVDVGERTGRLEEVFLRLGEHYDHLLKLRRAFFSGIAWPLFELVLALTVIGLFIWILGMVHTGSGSPPITFFGLWGTGGLAIYLGILGAIVGGIVLLVLAVKSGWVNISPLVGLLTMTPFLGKGLRDIAMSRLTWAMAITTDSEISAKRAVEMSVRTTQNAYYTSHLDQMQRQIVGGSDMYRVFAATGAYPDDFLDALQTGEISGRISESMAVMAKEFEDRVQNFFRVLTVVAGICVFLLVALMIIVLIFSLWSQYFGIIRDASTI